MDTTARSKATTAIMATISINASNDNGLSAGLVGLGVGSVG